VYYREGKKTKEALILIMSSRDFAFEKAASDGLQVTSNSSQKGSKLKS